MRKLLPMLMLILTACSAEPPAESTPEPANADSATDAVKPVVYQVFTRLYGNQETTNKPWGTIEENGVGKFADFTDAALKSIRELGTTHIWYTGVPHHGVIRDYT
ncbi:MAG: alpha-amylase, partial [Woeseiaceae bacterium]|nr:alpha-amylase [Woeseiaceae bacterium]